MNDKYLSFGKSYSNTCEYPQEESDSDRLRRTTDPNALRLDLVSAFAGDREMTETESTFLDVQKKNRGRVFYSDLFYAVSHHYFAPEISETLWHEVMTHKHLMSERLGRNVGIAVATLDYLSNITDKLSSLTLMSEGYVSEIANLSMIDGMTGLFNHTSCYELLELEFKRSRRYGIGMSLIMLDIDDFKLTNDRCGHQEGDRVLVALAKVLVEQTRDSDICCRFGGEEFIAILPFTDNSDDACQIAERIRIKVMDIECKGHRITISAGVALCDGATTTPQALIEKADHALYQAKAGGKNKIVFYVFK